jgi:hypothetical protein
MLDGGRILWEKEGIHIKIQRQFQRLLCVLDALLKLLESYYGILRWFK